MEQPVLSAGRGPWVETLTCCCYHSPCDQLRNSKYFLSDKGDWGRPEISGRVWASLISKHQAREVRISPGSAGLQVQSSRGLGWCGNRASCLSLTFNSPPAWAGRTFLPVFPLPLVWDLVPRGHIWDPSCAGTELSQLLEWFLRGRARHSPQIPYSPQLWLQQLLLPSKGKERGSHPLSACAGLWLCSSPPVAPDSSAFTVHHLSLLQQTLPFLGSKGFLELPFPKLGGTCHGKSSVENRLPALLGSLPCRGGALSWCPPHGEAGYVYSPVHQCSLPGHSGDMPAMGQEEPVEMCGTLSGVGPTESLRKADFLGNMSQGCSHLPPAERSAASGAVSKWLGCVSKGRTIPGARALALRDQNIC